MNLLGNHLFNFGSTLTMAVKPGETNKESETVMEEAEKQEINKYFDEIDNAEDDGRDLLSLKLKTKQFSTQYSAKNADSKPKNL